MLRVEPNRLGASHQAPVMSPDRIKLLQFLAVLAIGGTERQVMNLVERLDPTRFELSVACLRRFGEFLNEIEARRIPLAAYEIRSLFRPHALQQQLRFARHLTRNRIRILHTYGFYANVF